MLEKSYRSFDSFSAFYDTLPIYKDSDNLLEQIVIKIAPEGPKGYNPFSFEYYKIAFLTSVQDEHKLTFSEAIEQKYRTLPLRAEGLILLSEVIPIIKQRLNKWNICFGPLDTENSLFWVRIL